MDAAKEWQRLQARYAGMGDQELKELGDDYSSLTEMAQQILRDELRKRNLPDPATASEVAQKTSSGDPRTSGNWERLHSLTPDGLRDADSPVDAESDEANEGEGASGYRAYTWKTRLQTFATAEDAWMANEVLKQSGIESWLQVPRSAMDPTVPMIQVAADDLERAAAVLAKPIPEEIRSAANANVEDFELPRCPRCGAEDPLLEATDPVNQWSCEACGHTWKDEITPPE